MSIETEKKRLNDFLAEQTAAHEATKDRARAHRDSAVARSKKLSYLRASSCLKIVAPRRTKSCLFLHSLGLGLSLLGGIGIVPIKTSLPSFALA